MIAVHGRSRCQREQSLSHVRFVVGKQKFERQWVAGSHGAKMTNTIAQVLREPGFSINMKP